MGQERHKDFMFVVKSVGKETREDGEHCVLWDPRMADQSVGQGGGMGSQSANANPGDRERR